MPECAPVGCWEQLSWPRDHESAARIPESGIRDPGSGIRYLGRDKSLSLFFDGSPKVVFSVFLEKWHFGCLQNSRLMGQNGHFDVKMAILSTFLKSAQKGPSKR